MKAPRENSASHFPERFDCREFYPPGDCFLSLGLLRSVKGPPVAQILTSQEGKPTISFI